MCTKFLSSARKSKRTCCVQSRSGMPTQTTWATNRQSTRPSDQPLLTGWFRSTTTSNCYLSLSFWLSTSSTVTFLNPKTPIANNIIISIVTLPPSGLGLSCFVPVIIVRSLVAAVSTVACGLLASWCGHLLWCCDILLAFPFDHWVHNSGHLQKLRWLELFDYHLELWLLNQYSQLVKAFGTAFDLVSRVRDTAVALQFRQVHIRLILLHQVLFGSVNWSQSL